MANAVKRSAKSQTVSQAVSPVGARGGVYFDRVSKRFRKFTVAKQSYSTLKASLIDRLFRRGPPKRYLAALDNVTVSVPPGTSLGVIGRNGSGKSTMLKLIAGIYRPDSGSVNVNGRISALIELGAGFHPDFTGRENIRLGGVMYGLTRAEIDAREADIIRYAELEDFIDDPVRTYSSGMYMRLGFSLAIHTDPDILLVDEVLAVGDAPFVHRCQETISELKRQGKTLVFVTHDLDSVCRWCDEAIWLSKGRIRQRGEPRWVVDSYLADVEQQEEAELSSKNVLVREEIRPAAQPTNGTEPPANAEEAGPKRWGNGAVEITDVRMLDEAGQAKWLFHDEEAVSVEVDYRIKEPIKELVFGIGLLRTDGVCLHGSNTEIENVSVPLPIAERSGSFQKPLAGTLRYRIKKLRLLEASYYLDIAAHKLDGTPYDYRHRQFKFSVRNPQKYHGMFVPDHEWEFSVQYDVVPEQGKLAKEGR